MSVGCIQENRCNYCPVLHVDPQYRDEVASGIDALVHDGYGVDGESYSFETIAELAMREANENGDWRDAGIIAGALVMIAARKCDKTIGLE